MHGLERAVDEAGDVYFRLRPFLVACACHDGFFVLSLYVFRFSCSLSLVSLLPPFVQVSNPFVVDCSLRFRWFPVQI